MAALLPLHITYTDSVDFSGTPGLRRQRNRGACTNNPGHTQRQSGIKRRYGNKGAHLFEGDIEPVAL